MTTTPETELATEALIAWLTEDDARYAEAVDVLDWALECEWSPGRTASELLEWAGQALSEDVPSARVARAQRWASEADGAELAEWVDSCRDSE